MYAAQSNVYREDNKVRLATSHCLHLCFFSLCFHIPSLHPFGSKPSLTYSIPQQANADTQRAHTLLQSYKRQPAGRVGVGFLKLRFCSVHKCNRVPERFTIPTRGTRTLIIEGCAVKGDFHGKYGYVYRTFYKSRLEVGKRTTGESEKEKKEGSRWSRKASELKEKAVLAPLN